MKKIVNQKGYIVLMMTFFALIIMASIAFSMSFLVANEQRNVINEVKSIQAYYAAEAGAEDAILRLKKTPQISTLAYDLYVNNIKVSVNIPSSVGIYKNITSQATNGVVQKNVQVSCSIGNGSSTSFYYGVEVGRGGLSMGSGSEVIGNVFSSGNISGAGTIDNNAVVSGNGNSINGVTVMGNAFAYSCLSGAEIMGNLTYVTGGTHTCTVNGSTNAQPTEISEQPLPIPDTQIDDWKADAIAGGTFSGNKNINGSQSLGPLRITGSLTLSNNATLTLNGTVYVQGNITLGNGASINLASSYGSAGGVIIADGIINMGNNDTFLGSGQTGSYLLLISTSTSDSAIVVSNNSTGAVFYASAGGLTISNNVSVSEATGYKVIMENNSKIQYSSGIVNIYFTSGPSGGWEVANWQEY